MIQLPATAGRRAGLLGMGGGLLAIGAATTVVAQITSPAHVPVAIAAVVGGVLLFARPAIGVVVMFASVVFKPEAVQGVVAVNTLLSLALLGILAARVLMGDTRYFDVLRSAELRAFLLILLVMGVNWLLNGAAPPSHLSRLDQTYRSFERFIHQLLVLAFTLAFVRTRGQLLAVVGVFAAALLWTLPDAISRSYELKASRAAAVGGGIQAAENANRLAFVSLMGISMVWFLIQQYRGVLLRVAGVGLMFALGLAVLLSGSRSGFLNLLFLALLFLLQSKLRPGHIAAVVLVVLIVGTTAWSMVPQPIADRLLTVVGMSEGTKTGAEATLSAERRKLLLERGLHYFVENPVFGVGIGNFRWTTALDPLTGGLTAASHNAYLLALVEGGLPLLLAYLALFVVMLRSLTTTIRLADATPEVGLRWLALATRTSLLLLLVFSLFAEAWKEFYFVLLVQLAAVLAALYRRAQPAVARA